MSADDIAAMAEALDGDLTPPHGIDRPTAEQLVDAELAEVDAELAEVRYALAAARDERAQINAEIRSLVDRETVLARAQRAMTVARAAVAKCGMSTPDNAASPTPSGFDAERRVTVEFWVVVYAIRYGLGRKSYARGDAFRLADQHWDSLDEATKRDVVESDDKPWWWKR